MKNRYVGIDRFVSLEGETTYYVTEVNENKSTLVYKGKSKNGVHQVAHKYARLNNLPLYETIYTNVLDENGVSHLKPVQNKTITL